MNNKVPYRKASFSYFYASLRDIRFSVSASLPRTGRPFYCVATPMAIGRTTNNRNHDARIWTVYSRIIAFENLKQTTCSCRRRETSLHNFSSFLFLSLFFLFFSFFRSFFLYAFRCYYTSPIDLHFQRENFSFGQTTLLSGTIYDLLQIAIAIYKSISIYDTSNIGHRWW